MMFSYWLTSKLVRNTWQTAVLLYSTHRGVTSPYLDNTISGSQKSLYGWSNRDAHLHWRRVEEKYGLPFVPEFNHSDMLISSRVFFCHICRNSLLRSRNFTTAATWRNDFSFLFCVSSFLWLVLFYFCICSGFSRQWPVGAKAFCRLNRKNLILDLKNMNLGLYSGQW